MKSCGSTFWSKPAVRAIREVLNKARQLLNNASRDSCLLQNVASRMESTCRPGHIHVSAATQARLPNEPWRDLGLTAVKGKGQMRTFEWDADADEHLDGQQLQRVLGLYL